MNSYTESFKRRYGNKEVELQQRVMTIMDSRASYGPFSSGSNGYITKARVKDGVLEFYHDWWSYGWFSYDEMKKKWPCAVDCAIKQLGI